MKLKRLTACLLAGAMMLSIALTGCGTTINADAVGATLNGEEISLGFMNFMARYQQAVYDASYLAYLGNDMWKSEVSDGLTMEESTKAGVAENIQLMYLLEDHMADYGVELTAEETASVEKTAKQFMEDNSAKAIKYLGATEEYLIEMLRLNTIQDKMQTAIYDATEVDIKDEDAAQRTFSYVRVTISSKEDEIETQKKEMEELATALKEDFDKAAKDKEYKVYTYSYGKDESSMDKKVITAADVLKKDEVSALITTDKYYYVIRLDSELDEEKTAEKKEELIEAEKAEAYTEICEEYMEDSEFEINEEEWAKVKFDRLFGAAQ